MFSLEVANQQKERIQGEAEKLSLSHPNMLITWATGCGKGKCCMRILDKDNSGYKWLIVVPEILQIENLKADIIKHKMEHLYDKIEAIICYASFDNYKGWEGCIWFNEVHKLSKLRTDIAGTIKYHRVLADSATIPDVVRNRLYSLGSFEEYSISLSKAIELGVLPPPAIHIVYTQLKSEDKSYLWELEGKIEKLKERLLDGNQWAQNKLNQLGSHRKKFLGETKTEDLYQFIRQLKNKRTIVFTASIDQCNEVGKDYAIHSKKTKKHNLSTLQAFNNGEIEQIYVQKMGREGLNLENIEAVVITQLGSGNDEGLEFIQIMGRGLRSTAPQIFILTCRNTKDEQNLNKALSNIDKQYIYGKEKQQTTETKAKTGIQGRKRA